MNSSIRQLLALASKEEKLIIGIMSGTSLDGMDIALCRVSGQGVSTKLQLINFITVSYSGEFKDQLKDIVSVEQCSLQDICLMNTYMGDYIGEKVLNAIEDWQIDPAIVDCIASHGQTIYHAPKTKHRQPNMPNATLQIGDGDHIASKTGIITISDFRQKHTAAGGEGAPLVAPVDDMLFRDNEEYRLLLNIGGIANFTYLPPLGDGKTVTTDTGPGNTLLDQVARQKFNMDYDENGIMAAKGKVQSGLLKALKKESFFKDNLPKTTGPELFNWKYILQAVNQTDLDEVSSVDLLTTLAQLTADTIVDAVREVHTSPDPINIYISGGGIHNPVIINRLKEQLDNATIASFEKIGFNPDAKEAACFTVLANELVSGEGFRLNLENQKDLSNLGKISLPN